MKVGDLVRLKPEKVHLYEIKGSIGIIVAEANQDHYKMVMWAGQEKHWLYTINELEAIG